MDSENVNDNWIDTITEFKKSDEIRVFYTEKSMNVSCENISKIAGGEVNLNWVKCFTGQNALDFQLVTDLGYSVAKGSRDTFIIISNDKGYDAVVNYWVIKGINVSRQGVDMEPPKKAKRKTAARTSKEVKAKAVKKVQPKKSTRTSNTPKGVADKKATSTKADKAKTTKTSSAKASNAKSVPVSLWEKEPQNEKEYVEAIGRSISVKDLSRYHTVLTNLLGQDIGTEYYHKLKDDKELKAKIGGTYISRKAQRLDYILRIFLSYNKKGFSDLGDIVKIINSKKCDSLNNFYKLLTEKFKEEKGRTYYNIFKGIYSILKSI